MAIETERLFIYPANEDEMKDFISRQEDEVLRMAYREMLNGCIMHPQQWEWFAIWFIRLKDGTHIGELCFKGVDDEGMSEIGYGIDEEFRGAGYATEAVGAVAEWAFRQPGINGIVAETDADNVLSIRVLEKCGFENQNRRGAEGPLFIKRKPLHLR